MKVRIGILGSCPPPYGGVSVSIKQCSEIWVLEGYEVHMIEPRRAKAHELGQLGHITYWIYKLFNLETLHDSCVIFAEYDKKNRWGV